jgi:hypothetical protein
LISVNRMLLEGLDWRLQKVEESLDNRDQAVETTSTTDKS